MKLKWLHRLNLITSNAIRQLINPLVGFIIAYLVFNFATKEIWGAFVSFLLFVLIISQVTNWGNKEYLIRAFSENPSKIEFNWTQLLINRFPLVIITSLLSLVFFNESYLPYIFIWVFGKYLSQSVEPLIIYEKKFKISIAIEILSFGLFYLLFLYFKSEIDLFILIKIYSQYQLLKGLLYIIAFKKKLSIEHTCFSMSFLKSGLPFFILSILGFLTTKADIYLLDIFEENKMLAEYQIISGLFVFVMSISMFLYTPFTKNIYRADNKTIFYSQKLIGTIGAIITPLCLTLIYMICGFFYKINIPISYLVVGFILIYPSFIYGLHILFLLKNNKENKVVFILTVGSIINILFTSIFLNLNLGILGALSGSSIAQITISFFVLRASKRLQLKT